MTFAIIVPYRDRERHLARFLPWYRNYLPGIKIYVIEQADDKPFNRGWLLNVGALVTTEDVLIFHDVDMLVVNGHKNYLIPPVSGPVQLATHAEQFGYKMPFSEYLGGVTMYLREDFVKINGYSNKFWGWGGEDNEMYDNVIKHNLSINYKNCYHASLAHPREFGYCLPADHPNYKYWKQGRDPDDGLDHCRFENAGMMGARIKVRQRSYQLASHQK